MDSNTLKALRVVVNESTTKQIKELQKDSDPYEAVQDYLPLSPTLNRYRVMMKNLSRKLISQWKAKLTIQMLESMVTEFMLQLCPTFLLVLNHNAYIEPYIMS